MAMANDDGGEELQIFNYDVFISFRGKDTRDSFTQILHKELKRKGIRTFVDDKMLKEGDVISPALTKAIEESTVLLVVLSENYASSSWCLDELVKILECARRGNQQLVYPIFYHVEPFHVRYQRETYAEAMARHEDRYGINSDKVQTWRSALNQVCQFVGRHITSTGTAQINDAEEIVEKVYARIISKPVHGTDPVGFEQRIQELKSLLDMKADDDIVSMLGIYGLGGIGKTEIAKALYSKIVHKFEAGTFISNVREKSKKINGMEDLQMALLSNMSELIETELSNASRGTYEIKRRLGKKKVLLVLDDVDDIEQLNNLAGKCSWFGSGSRIIVTTRDEDLLRHHRIEKTYRMVELDDQQALELFCQNAFGNSHPKSGYEEMCSRAVKYAKGLPLALKILGTDLATQSLENWEYSLDEYKKYLNPMIQDVLQRSYERLPYNVKQVFLDIAFFFNGERIEYVEKILNESNASQAIKVLIHKSLLTVDEDGCLNMNGLIQDMAREIVRMEEPRNPGKRSRLCSHEDFIEVLTQNLGTDTVEGIILDGKRNSSEQKTHVEWGDGTAFEKMRYLRILIIRNTTFSTEPKQLPNHLRYLDWEEYPSKFFPPGFHPKDIVVFKLCKSYLTLVKPFKKFSGLTSMNFSSNQSISSFPDVSAAPDLREIILDDCKNLIKVHDSVGVLEKLARLSGSGCSKLRDFPKTIYLPSLRILNLNSCSRLEHFPEIEKNMNQPLEIYMKSTYIEKLPDSISKLTGLVCIEMSGSKKLRYLPSSLFMLPNVVTFKFGRCSSNIGESFRKFVKDNATTNGRSTLKTLHLENGGLSDEDLLAILKSFPELKELIASGNNFVSLPECIKESVHLTSMDVSFCTKLEKIPECSSLINLNVDCCESLQEISELPSTIQKVDARYCHSLTPETSDMLWSQVKKEIRGLEIIMHPSKIPELLFDWRDNGGNPRFWARGKFPIVAIALVFNYEEELEITCQLNLVINGKCVPRKGYYNLGFGSEFVLICDLRLLFSEEEWHGLDAFLVHDWNLVQVSFEASSTTTTTTKLLSWGVYVYKQGTNMEDIRFMCPGSDDPLLQELMMAVMMKGGGDESEAKSKLYWKLIEEHDALRKRFEPLQNETSAAELDSWKHQYHELLEKLNIGSNTRSALSTVTKLGAVLKGRDEELKGLCDAQIEIFQNTKEFHDLLSAVYLKGVRDGVLETQAILVALDTDGVTPLGKQKHGEILNQTAPRPAGSQVDSPGDTSYLSEEHVTHHDDHNHKQEHDVTHEDADDSETLNQTAPRPAASQVDKPEEHVTHDYNYDDDDDDSNHNHKEEHDVTHEEDAAAGSKVDNPGDTSSRSRIGFRRLFLKK